jgi:hypothetical protein
MILARRTSSGSLDVKAYVASVRATGCVICGETDIEVLDFHHVDPATKSFHLSGSYYNHGMDKVVAEIAKCVVLCANDHRRVHAGTRDIPKEKLP